MKVRNETNAEYVVSNKQGDDGVIAKALEILHKRLTAQGVVQKMPLMGSPKDISAFLMLKMATLEHETFSCSFLNAQHRLIAHEELFRGTLTQTSVYPREVVKVALKHNAAAVILSHNHPSGTTEPSRADEALTQSLKSALALIDVRVLDHIIVAGKATTSFAERGLL